MRAARAAQANPAHAALDATAAASTAAFGQAVTTVATVKDTWKQDLILGMAKVESGPAAAPMRCTDK
jgi:hypothetical protein